MSIEPKIKETISGEVFGVTLITAPPPSSGSLSIPALRILQRLEQVNLPLHSILSKRQRIYSLGLAITKITKNIKLFTQQMRHWQSADQFDSDGLL